MWLKIVRLGLGLAARILSHETATLPMAMGKVQVTKIDSTPKVQNNGASARFTGKMATEKTQLKKGQQKIGQLENLATEKCVIGKRQHLCNHGTNGNRKFGQR